MAEKLIRLYTCDGGDDQPAVVRFVFQPPDARMMVVDLCEEDWLPIGTILQRVIAGARPLRDAAIRSTYLTAAGDTVDARPTPTRTAAAAAVTGDGRWVPTLPTSASGAPAAHWTADELTVRCGLMSAHRMDWATPLGDENKRCRKCLELLTFDARAGRVSARAAAGAAPVLFSSDDDVRPSPPPVDKRSHAPGQFTDLAKSLTFDEWPKHASLTWVDVAMSWRGRHSISKAHARLVDKGTSVCSRLDKARMETAPDSTGEHPLCSLCLGGVNKIIRDDGK